MKKKLFMMICLTSCTSVFAFINGAEDLNKMAPYEFIGLITNKEAVDAHLQYLKVHPDAVDDSKVWLNSNKYVPNHIHFMQIKPNPLYNKENLSPRIKLNEITDLPPYGAVPIRSDPMDQGAFGTCTTFAAIGSMINQNPSYATYSSQPSPSCLLNFMVSDSRGTVNPWNSATIFRVVSTLWKAGIIKNSIGDTGFCNSSYPVYQPYGLPSQSGQGLTIPFSTYNSQISWPSATWRQLPSGLDGPSALNLIKEQINDYVPRVAPGFETIFSFYAPSTFTTTVVGNRSYDTWFYTGTDKGNTLHAIYAFGYDDTVCVNVPDSLSTQCGVLFLRNSWGNRSYNGIYLMTYQYFNHYYNNNDALMSIR